MLSSIADGGIKLLTSPNWRRVYAGRVSIREHQLSTSVWEHFMTIIGFIKKETERLTWYVAGWFSVAVLNLVG